MVYLQELHLKLMNALLGILFLALLYLSVLALRQPVSLQVTQLCNKPDRPTLAEFPTCVWYCPDEHGSNINKILFINNDSYSLHGFWTNEFSKEPIRIPFDDFRTMKITFKIIMYDLSTLRKEINCGIYRNYWNHGVMSGFNFNQWLNNTNTCDPWNFGKFYPHQCRFNGTHNFVQSISNYKLPTIGCKSDFDFISRCFK